MIAQIILTSGETELVVISRREYDALQARAGLDAAEDAMADRMVRDARMARETGGDAALPAWLSAAILAGEHPIRAARHHVGLTQEATAAKAGIPLRALDAAENGGTPLDRDAIEILAPALGVHPDWLAD